MKISTHIFDLLREHDCVIIPDFGAFVTRNISVAGGREPFSFEIPADP